MPVSRDIARSYRAPRRVMREMLAAGPREDRAIAILMAGCGLVFVSQWPSLARAEYLGGAPLDRALAYGFFAWLMIMPLALYGLAAVAHLLARVFGGRGSFFGARLALFWALLASAPLILLYGLTAGLIGPGIEADIAGGAWLAAFLAFWIAGMLEAERPRGGALPDAPGASGQER